MSCGLKKLLLLKLSLKPLGRGQTIAQEKGPERGRQLPGAHSQGGMGLEMDMKERLATTMGTCRCRGSLSGGEPPGHWLSWHLPLKYTPYQ